MTIPKLNTVKQHVEKYPAIPNGGVRHLIFHAKNNGLAQSGALVHVGRRVLIDEEKWFKWLTTKANEALQTRKK